MVTIGFSSMLEDVRLVIVGLGLMGGSLAYAMRPHVKQIVAVNRGQAALNAALESGVIDSGSADFSSVRLTPNDLVVFGTPVRIILQQLAELPRHAPDGCMVIDMGSTKREICRAMNELPGRFQAMGGHPMCGKEVSGFEHSSADLYQDQTFILTPTVRTTPYLLEVIREMLVKLGSRPLFIPPEKHDQIVASISHLPYLVSAVLMRLAAASADGNPMMWHASASGFRDTSRLAGSDPTMMRDILLTNREAVLGQLRHYQAILADVEKMLESADGTTINSWLTETQSTYRHYRHQKEFFSKS